jgi:exodeoxyribonuclease III
LVRVATFNINNINKRLDNLLAWLAKAEPDVVSLQELKAEQGAFPANALRTLGYEAVWQGERSWNGVAILARNQAPVLTCASLPGNPEDHQARYIEAAVQGVLITSIYLPNGNPQPGPKFNYKLAWFERLIAHTAELMASGAPVVLAGDYNVVPTPQDIYPTRSLDNNALIQPESRQAFARLLAQGWTDAMRRLHPDDPLWTFWDYKYERLAEGQRHATRSLSALAEGVGPARGRWCRPVGAWAGKRQRPCANMDNARSLDQSCVNHEFIESKPLGAGGARVLSKVLAKTRQAPGQLPPRTTSHLLFVSNHRQA